MRRAQRRVLIGGLPYFGRMLADMLDGDGWQCRYLPSAGRRPAAWAATAAALSRADLVYLIGGQIERWSRPDWLVRLGRRPVVVHWVGSDVTYALGVARRRAASRSLLCRPVHWAEVEWTAAELRLLGIDAHVVPLTSLCLVGEVVPLPQRFTVLCYLPDARPDFYGRPFVMQLAASFPEARFLVAGTEGRGWAASANVEFLGWRSQMAPVYAQSSVLLRLPRHDGLSFMVLEALAAGRRVIWSHALDGVVEVHSEGEARQALAALADAHARGMLRPDEAAARLTRERFSPARVRAEILSGFESALAEHRR